LNAYVRVLVVLAAFGPLALPAQVKQSLLPVGSAGYESGQVLGVTFQGVRQPVDTLDTRPTVILAEYRRSANDGWHLAGTYDRWTAGNQRRSVVHAFVSREPFVFFDSDLRLMPRRHGIDFTQQWRRTERTWTYVGVGLHESEGDGSYFFPIGGIPWIPCDTTGSCGAPLHLQSPPNGATTIIRRPPASSIGISIGGVTPEYQALSARFGSVTDTRDNIFAPTRGRVLDVSVRASSISFGSPESERYYSARAELRGYKSLASGAVLAGQMFAGLDSELLPEFESAGFGRIGRGFPPGRAPGDLAVSLEGEWRGPTQWMRNRLGSAVFASVSSVHYNRGNPNFGPFIAAGVGLRYRIDPETRNTLRLDVAFNSDKKPVLLLALQEAF